MIKKNGKILVLTEQEFIIVSKILKDHPDVIIFGSRVKGTNKPFSDLDICLKKPMKDYEYTLLREAFEKSNLPFTVDLVDYNKIDDSFRKIIDEEGIPLAFFIDKK
jgi:predicted nucleotidyltransferase